MKVSAKIYKGIEYVQLNELPKEQKEKISESLNEETLIKIMIGEKITHNCLLYKDYEFWFDNVFRVEPLLVKEVASIGAPVEMVLGKV